MDKFIFMLEWADALETMSNEDKGILLQNLINHHKGEPIDTSSAVVNPVFNLLIKQYGRINTKYQTSVENGRKGGAPKGTRPWNKKDVSEPKANPKQTQKEPEANQEQTYKEKEKEKEKEIKKENVMSSVYENLNENLTHTREHTLSKSWTTETHKPKLPLYELLNDQEKLEADLALERLLNKK